MAVAHYIDPKCDLLNGFTFPCAINASLHKEVSECFMILITNILAYRVSAFPKKLKVIDNFFLIAQNPQTLSWYPQTFETTFYVIHFGQFVG